MRKLIAISALCISFTASAAQTNFNWFQVGARCQVNGAQANCAVYNRYYRPIFCQVQGGGTTRFGMFMNGQISGWVRPGANMFLNVFARNPYRDPLVRAYANANCRF